ncbi:hypothetical protein QR680_001281 [Steinernema hermaphroditum]|uniref:Uncharacterized protein n=1 Tax=Steinernema hermaphroditum TaxID=289476 RepID=A0AA39LF47_9BILA|nr:hypothetical protein QR680_001281 [Steinernema hermaphroditum]
MQAAAAALDVAADDGAAAPTLSVVVAVQRSRRLARKYSGHVSFLPPYARDHLLRVLSIQAIFHTDSGNPLKCYFEVTAQQTSWIFAKYQRTNHGRP